MIPIQKKMRQNQSDEGNSAGVKGPGYSMGPSGVYLLGVGSMG